MRPLFAVLLLSAPAAAADRKLEYNRDVRPILAETCFACHGPDSAARKAKLRLDQRAAAVEQGAIVPGKPAESEMIARILLPADDDGLMPPAKSHKALKPEQKEILRKWVEQGAEYQAHWSLIPPTRPAVPTVKTAGWVRTPIDAFVLAELEKRNLTPAPEADRHTLARRLALDLTGLPPAPEDVEEFVKDQSPTYYEKYVDKLMASPHWGEHRGRFWLDAARYADTHGIHFDNYREVWAYRDWVINAFNRNQRFDRFTTEQLAGDLLPNPSLEQRIATGFIRCNITTNEGGVIAEEYAVLYTRDRTETVSQVWMGQTAGCAVCHDHKFDPLSQQEFYSLAAFFNNFTQAVMDGNVPNTPPIIPVPRAEDRARFVAIEKELAEVRGKLAARKTAAKADFTKWLGGVKAEEIAARIPTDKLHLHARLAEGKGKAIAATVDGKERTLTLNDGFAWVKGKGKDAVPAFQISQGAAAEFADVGDFDTKDGFTVSTWVKITRRGTTGAIVARMDVPGNGFRGWDLWMEADKIGMHLINKFPEDALKVVGRTPLKPNEWTHVTVKYDGSAKPEGVQIFLNGKPEATDTPTNTLKGTIKTKVPFKIGQRTADSRLQNVAMKDLRVYARPLTGPEAEQLATAPHLADVLAKPADKRTAKEKDELFDWFLAAQDKPYQELDAAEAKLQAEEVTLRSKGTIAHVANEKTTPAEAYILNRGEYDQRKDKVAPDTPKAILAFPKELPKNRLGFAQWLLSKDHPLTGRVTVNRFWQEVFGTGLVRTAGDFGVTGELPSHPELLDWMAEEFESHWDVKRFFKLIVTSAAYRQSAAVTKEKLEKDASNTWLSRGPRFRMDAEMIRDGALAASGLLVRKQGGASVKPYQPEGVWEAVAMIGSNTRDYKRDAGESLYRRSMYTFWKRSAPPASMEIMNAPNREQCTVKRDRTNTPLQALVTLNDVQFVEAARVLAELAMKTAKTDDARLDAVTTRVLARPFRPAERAIALESLAALRKEYAANPAEAKKLLAFGEKKADPALDAAELAAWAMLANQVLNLDEALNK